GIALIGHDHLVAVVLQCHHTCTRDMTRPAAALPLHPLGRWRFLVGMLDLAANRAPHRTDAELHGGLILVGADLVELFASGHALGDGVWAKQGIPHRLEWGLECVAAVEVHS